MGCGRKEWKGKLLRFTISREGILLVDALQRRGGRGGYLCPQRGCFRLALRKRRINHGLRGHVTLEFESWVHGVEQHLLDFIHGTMEKVNIRHIGEDEIASLWEKIQGDEVGLALFPFTATVVEKREEIEACCARTNAECLYVPPEITKGRIITMTRSPEGGMNRLSQAIKSYITLRSEGDSE